MKLTSPVIPGLKDYEITLGGAENNQPEYDPLPCLRSPEGVVVCRFSFTDEERAAIAAGEDIWIRQLTMNNPFQAIDARVGMPHETPENFKRAMRLDDAFELKTLLKEANEAVAALHSHQLAILNADKETKDLAAKAQQTKQAFERKKAELFSDKPGPRIEVVQ